MSCDQSSESTTTNRAISRVSPWLPNEVVEKLKAKGTLTPLEIIRLLSILPNEAYLNFQNIPNKPLVFPKDHNMHFMQSQEWFYLALNLKTVGKTPQRWGALSSIVRRSIQPPSDDMLSAPSNNNQVFRSSFSITTEHEHHYLPDVGGTLSSLFSVTEAQKEKYAVGTFKGLPYATWYGPKTTSNGMVGGAKNNPKLQNTYNNLPIFTWKIQDDVSGASLDLVLQCKAPLLMQGPDKNGILNLPDTGVNYMYYSFPHLEVISKYSTVTLPNSKPINVTGVGWLDHQGGVIKPVSGILSYLSQWQNLFGMKRHRLAWVWLQAQFPQTSPSTYITGASIVLNPKNLKVGSVLPWFGTVMTDNKSIFYDKNCHLTVKKLFKSPDLDVNYVIEVEVKVSDSISFTSTSIFPDQRVYPADQGEIYEGAADTLLNGKIPGYGYIENMAFSSYEELVKQQYSKLGLSGLPIPVQFRPKIDAVVTIIIVLALVTFTVYFFWSIKKMGRK